MRVKRQTQMTGPERSAQGDQGTHGKGSETTGPAGMTATSKPTSQGQEGQKTEGKTDKNLGHETRRNSAS